MKRNIRRFCVLLVAVMTAASLLSGCIIFPSSMSPAIIDVENYGSLPDDLTPEMLENDLFLSATELKDGFVVSFLSDQDNAWIERYDSKGTLMWNEEYALDSWIESIAATPDGGFAMLIIGNTALDPDDSVFPISLVRCNADGEVLWGHDFSMPNYLYSPSWLFCAHDGTLFAVHKAPRSSDSAPEDDLSICISKFAPDGALVAERFIGASKTTSLFNAGYREGIGLLIQLYHDDFYFDEEIDFQPSEISSELMLLREDDLSPVWSMEDDQTKYLPSSAWFPTEDGIYLSTPIYSPFDVRQILAKIRPEGGIEWEQKLSSEMLTAHCVLTPNGQIAVVGETAFYFYNPDGTLAVTSPKDVGENGFIETVIPREDYLLVLSSGETEIFDGTQYDVHTYESKGVACGYNYQGNLLFRYVYSR